MSDSSDQTAILRLAHATRRNHLLGFGGGGGIGTGDVPIAAIKRGGGGGGGIGAGEVPIANEVGGGGGGGIGTGEVPIAPDGGGGGGGIGTGEVPIATKVVLPVAFPATMDRTETAVRTTNTASNKLRTEFFI